MTQPVPRPNRRTRFALVQPGVPGKVTPPETDDRPDREPARASWLAPVPDQGAPAPLPRRALADPTSLDLPADLAETTRRAPHTYWGGRRRTPLPWNPLPYMEEWIEAKNVEDLTVDYLRRVKNAMAHFAEYAARNGITHPEEVDRKAILAYQAYLLQVRQDNGQSLSQGYRAALLVQLRSWLHWMHDVGYIERDPWVRIKVSRPGKKPKPLEPEDVAALFEAHRSQAFKIPPFSFHRREVVLALLFGWGLRIHELHWLDVTNVDMRLNWVTVRNKGGNTKTLPYNDMLKQVVQRWLVQRARYANQQENALLVDQQGKRMSIPMIRKVVTDCGANAGISINPHRLRDTFATTMLDQNVEIERIMAMMGHTNQKQTLAYTRVNNPNLKESHDRVMGPLLGELLTTRVPQPDLALTDAGTAVAQAPESPAQDQGQDDDPWVYVKGRGWMHREDL